MYNLSHFKDPDQGALLEFMNRFPFVLLSGCSEEGKPVCTQVPVMVEEKEGTIYLQGHIMRNTDHHKAFARNPQALCVFTSPHVYVSATWYDNPHQASTWNYMSVHARGQLHFLEDESLIEVMRKTTLHFENGDTDSTTIYDRLTEKYKAPLLKAIIGFEIRVDSLEHVFKLSQNRDHQSYRNIIEKLDQGNEDSRFISNEMKKREALLFKL